MPPPPHMAPPLILQTINFSFVGLHVVKLFLSISSCLSVCPSLSLSLSLPAQTTKKSSFWIEENLTFIWNKPLLQFSLTWSKPLERWRGFWRSLKIVWASVARFFTKQHHFLFFEHRVLQRTNQLRGDIFWSLLTELGVSTRTLNPFSLCCHVRLLILWYIRGLSIQVLNATRKQLQGRTPGIITCSVKTEGSVHSFSTNLFCRWLINFGGFFSV